MAAPPPAYGNPGPYGAAAGETAPPPVASPSYGAPPPATDGPYGGQPNASGGPTPPAYVGEINKNYEKFPAAPVYQDKWWIFPFAAQFIVMIVLSIYFNTKSSSSSSGGTTTTTTTTTSSTTSVYPDDFSGLVTTAFVLAVLFPIITASTSLWVMRQYAHCLVWASMIFGCLMCLLMAVVFFATKGGAVVGVFFVILFLINVWWVFAVRSRVPFAVAVLETVVDVVRQRSATVGVSFASIFVHAGWNSAWVAAAVGTYQAASQTNSAGLMRITYFFLALSYYWTSQVVSNVVMVTCAGVMAEWYFKAPNQPEKATSRALGRATTTSLGSIIYGSFLIAIIKALRSMANQRGRQNLVSCIINCILACFEGLIKTINFWAFTYVSIYGMPYCDACKATFELFANRGFDLIINEDLIAGVLVMMAFISAVISALVIFVVSRFILLGKYVDSTSNYNAQVMSLFVVILATFLAFWLGLMFTITALNVVQACVAALYVSYAEDPAALANTKPEVYNKLTNAFLERYRGKVAMFMY